jgi:hypothetical protein
MRRPDPVGDAIGAIWAAVDHLRKSGRSHDEIFASIRALAMFPEESLVDVAFTRLNWDRQ